MAVPKDLLDILCCPETKEPVSLLPDVQIARINAAIQGGGVKLRNGEAETKSIDGGLLRQDGKYLYAIREDIPIMLMDEAIDMSTVK